MEGRPETRSHPRRNGATTPPPPVRVAIYTRKSTADGLDQELNSLQAQRQTAQAYIHSQQAHGWVALPDHYDDGGFTGANTARPSFQRLLTDIEAGKVDCVAVYKIDRLSRSLSDFAGIMDLFENHGVTFVSVTQQFSTATSVGKLTLNLLMSFAEFERDVISERTRDKIAACRRKGLWTGGRPVLGYDIRDKRLVINEEEATTVRTIFDLYLECGSLLGTVRELHRREVCNKTFRSSTGRVSIGKSFTKPSLQTLLTNPLYSGRVRSGGVLAVGVHDAIVERTTWDAVQARLRDNSRSRLWMPREKWGSLLEGLLRCGICGEAMSHHYTAREGRTYRYYVCQTQQKLGASACPRSRVRAAAIEAHVLEQVARVGTERALLDTAVAEVRNRNGAARETAHRQLRCPDTSQGAGFVTVEPGWNQLEDVDRERVLRSLIARVVYTALTDEVEIELRPPTTPPPGKGV